MSARFVIAAAAADGAPRCRTATWPVYRLGPTVISAPPETQVLQAGDVMIIGRLVQRTSVLTSLSPDAAAAIIASDGRACVADYWGSYIALWRSRHDGAVHVLRDPSGAVPLFRAGRGENAILFSDLDDVWPLAPGQGLPDWDSLAHQLLYPQSATARTALQGVTALLPGQACRLDGTALPRQLWSPWPFAERAADPAPFAAAAESLRHTVDTATAALVPAASVLLELSGGLDSSMFAASLDKAGADWSAVTIATPAPDGDEREFARAVTDYFGARLHSLRLTPSDLNLVAVPDTRTTAPTGFGMLAGLDSAIHALAVTHGASALVSGIGGDNVFCSLRSPAPVLDAWRDRGLGQAIRTAADLGNLTSSDHWTTLRQTLNYAALDRRRPGRWTIDPRFLSRDWHPNFEPHPWLVAGPDRRAGRRAHIVMLLRAHGVIHAHARARRHAMQTPLLAQPVMEACLAIPAWHWIEGGRDRAVARAAFAGRLPALTIARRSKGRLESLVAPAYNRDRTRLRDQLADGRLAAAGIIDRSAVIAAFAAPASALDDVYIRLLELADVEFWLASVA